MSPGDCADWKVWRLEERLSNGCSVWDGNFYQLKVRDKVSQLPLFFFIN